MVQINFARKEINCKLVYYGPGLSGKTTNLEMVHLRTPEEHKGELTSISTDGDRTLFFDFMPLDLGEIAGMKTKFHLYTVPGQVYYNSTRKLVLLGADGVIFVADSSRAKLAENHESLDNLRENLAEMGKDMSRFPLVLQWNKRDMPDAMPVEELEAELNKLGAPSFEAIANKGDGVFGTLKALSARVLASINSTERGGFSAPESVATEVVPPPRPATEPAAGPVEATASAGETAPVVDHSPPPLGGFQIEHNEVAAPQRDDPEPVTIPQEVACRAPSMVASNPLEEIGALPTDPAPPPRTPPAPPPTTVAATPARQVEKAPVAVAEAGERSAPRPQPRMKQGSLEDLAPEMRRRTQQGHRKPHAEESYRREVRVIGGRRSGAPAPSNNKSLIVGVVCGVAAAAAAAYAYVHFLA